MNSATPTQPAPLDDAGAMAVLSCYDCGRPYGDEHGFPDLVVPHDIWNAQLSPEGNEGGLLCPSCMCKRAHDAEVSCEAFFTSGPFATESRAHLAARLAELEAEIEVQRQQNRLGAAREMDYLDRATRAEAELAAAKVDAERYRWLRGCATDELAIRFRTPNITHPHLWAYYMSTGIQADAAIDAARGEGGNKTEDSQ